MTNKIETKETDHVDAGRYKFFAARDAAFKSAINKTRFDDQQKLRAERVKLALELVYSYQALTLDYTKKHIRVKVSKPNIKDRKNLRQLENDWADQGIIKVFTNQGIIYRVI